MRIVVVDDSMARVDLIKNALLNCPCADFLDIVICDSADKARVALIHPCDMLILDVLLPKKSFGVPQAKHSVNLLTEICDPLGKYIRPRMLIGLTADIKDISDHQEKFSKEAVLILRGQLSDVGWVEKMLAQVESLSQSDRKSLKSVKDRVFISVHGIRTYGQWQAKLTEEISQYSRSINAVEIKFHFLNIFAFAIPYFRNKVVSRAADRLILNIQKNSGRDIYVVAHSFGTIVVSEAMRRSKNNDVLKAIILCGSPMPYDQDVEHIISAAEITINECGTRDIVLVFARLFVWGLGDAGRIGFERENSHEFFNRYFKGGHDLYFAKKTGESSFYEKYWLNLFVSGTLPNRVDQRQGYFGEDFFDLLLKVVTFLKPLYYLLIAILFFRFLLIKLDFLT